MLRVLDVPGALEGSGWPATDAEAVFSVHDALFPDNAGPWLLRVEGGRATVTRRDDDHPKAVPIGLLSSMFTGYLRPADAVRLGALAAADPTVEAFGRLFSGPDPWCPFFF